MKLEIRHETVYRYDVHAHHSTQYLRLTPPSTDHQRVVEWQLNLPGKASSGVDAFGNIFHVLTLDHPHDEIHLIASGVVETTDQPWQQSAGLLSPLVFLRTTPLTECDHALRQFAQPFAAAIATDPTTGLQQLAAAILDAMPYRKGETFSDTPAAMAFAQGAGVCQDHSHVFIACCRQLGIPARYVSGYLVTDDEGHVASHAWAEAWFAEAWHGFDISNAMTPDGHHLTLAVGLDYLDACPVRGVRHGGGGEELHARAEIRVIEE